MKLTPLFTAKQGLASILLSGGLLLLSGSAHAQFFTPGDFVVSRVGDGSTALSSAAAPVFLDEYSSDFNYVQSKALPVTASESNRRITASGSATGDGVLTLSADGHYLTYGGYDAAVGTASVATTTSATVNRVVAQIGADGNIDTSTALSDAFSGSNIRSTASVDGSSFWVGGAVAPGVRSAALGGTTSTTVNIGAVTNVRVANIFNTNLYFSTAAGSRRGIYGFTGLPTGGATPTLLIDTGSSSNPDDFYFADSSTCFIADSTAGLQKWKRNPTTGTWSRSYQVAMPIHSLMGFYDPAIQATDIVATTTDGSKLIGLSDVGTSPTFTTLALAGTNRAFRGVDYAPTAPAPTTPAPSALLTLLVGMPLIGTKLRARHKL